jgi:hypothetical protein
MLNNVAYNELRQRREGEPSQELLRDRELLEGFWEAYPAGVAENSLLSAQLVQAVLQAEQRKDRLRQRQADTVDIDVTREFIRSVVDRVAA